MFYSGGGFVEENFTNCFRSKCDFILYEFFEYNTMNGTERYEMSTALKNHWFVFVKVFHHDK